jgi:hypothetical protein
MAADDDPPQLPEVPIPEHLRAAIRAATTVPAPLRKALRATTAIPEQLRHELEQVGKIASDPRFAVDPRLQGMIKPSAPAEVLDRSVLDRQDRQPDRLLGEVRTIRELMQDGLTVKLHAETTEPAKHAGGRPLDWDFEAVAADIKRSKKTFSSEALLAKHLSEKVRYRNPKRRVLNPPDPRTVNAAIDRLKLRQFIKP